MTRWPQTGISLLLIVLCAGCSEAAGPAAPGSVKPHAVDLRELPPSPQGGAGRLQVMPAPGIPDYRPRLLRDTKLDLGRRLGLDISAITVKVMEAVTWSNGALGCPRPGESYTQALVPGYRIVLTAAGRDWTYHTDARTLFRACPFPEAAMPK